MIFFIPWSPTCSTTMLDRFAQLFHYCWNHESALHMVSMEIATRSCSKNNITAEFWKFISQLTWWLATVPWAFWNRERPDHQSVLNSERQISCHTDGGCSRPWKKQQYCTPWFLLTFVFDMQKHETTTGNHYPNSTLSWKTCLDDDFDSASLCEG